MAKTFDVNNNLTADIFLNQAGIELKRAERYRIFVALVVLDLSNAKRHFNGSTGQAMEKVRHLIRQNVRSSDNYSFIDDYSVAILFPETSRQGAEVTARRLSEKIRDELASMSPTQFDDIIPLEMASFPDTGGARPVEDFLGELADRVLSH